MDRKGNGAISRALRLLEDLLPRISGTRLRFIYYYTYARQIEQDPLEDLDGSGTLPNGKPYSLRTEDVAMPEERGKGISHYCSWCESNGSTVGYVHLLSGKIWIEAFQKDLEFDGWYVWDAYVDSEFRGNRINGMMIEHGLRIAPLPKNDKVTAFVNFYNKASVNSFERMGFHKESRNVFIGILGKGHVFDLPGTVQPNGREEHEPCQCPGRDRP